MHTNKSRLLIPLVIAISFFVSGICILINPVAGLTTQYYTFFNLAVSLGGTGISVGGVLVFVALMGMLGSTRYLNITNFWRTCLILPMEIIAFFQTYAIYLVMVEGVYPDGYHPGGSSLFIITDQSLNLTALLTNLIWFGTYFFRDYKE